MMKYISEHLPKWIIGIIASGFVFAVTTTWTISTLWNDVQRDLGLIKCRIGVDVSAEDCAYVKPITEDIEEAVAEKEEAYEDGVQ